MTTPAGGGDITPACADVVTSASPGELPAPKNAAGSTGQAGKTVTPGLTAPRAPELCTGAGRAHPARIRMGVAGLHPWWTRVRDAAPARAQINAAPSRMRIHDHYDHEDMMNNRIDTDLLLAERADQVAHLSDELRNAKALADKLQTLLDSKTHQADALHKELDTALKANELITEAATTWQLRAEVAEAERAAVTTLLIAHADGAFLVGDPSPEEIARHVVAKIAADAEPDMDTVPLEVLLDTVRTFLDDEQEITVLSGTDGVVISMLDRKFFALTSEARDLLEHGTALRGNLFEL